MMSGMFQMVLRRCQMVPGRFFDAVRKVPYCVRKVSNGVRKV